MFKLPKIVQALIDEGPDIALILFFAAVASLVVRLLFKKVKDIIIERMNKRGDSTAFDTERNVKTIESVLERSVRLFIWTSAVLACLNKLHIDISPILTGAGVVGLAVGFGSQTIIKDVIAGLFLLIENQIRINDSVMINNVAGAVEEVNLRTTVIRAENGALHIFPNGSISSIANFSRQYAFYVLEYNISTSADPKKAFEVLTRIVDEMREEPEYKAILLAPVEIHGVDKIRESAVGLRARIKTIPGRNFSVGREINRRVLTRFPAEGVQLSNADVNVHIAGGELAGAAQAALTRENIKAIVREIQREDAAIEAIAGPAE
ncbi:MAG: mechanosensitive ion channel family protein [Acidobacteria bacterium]|nr:mechanosensitive ion channel family protein [Acidobacteriota bacterium]